jgi:hypothetical protein
MTRNPSGLGDAFSGCFDGKNRRASPKFDDTQPSQRQALTEQKIAQLNITRVVPKTAFLLGF